MADLLQTVMGVLTSPSAKRIDFHLGLIHVDAIGLAAVKSLVSVSAVGGVRIDIVKYLPKGVAAQYDNATNTLQFTRKDYGATAGERAVILHECVHALHDVYGGGYYHPRGGSRFMTASENEAAAYVAGCLYHLYETGKTLKGDSTIFYHAAEIAKRIMHQRGAYVTTDEATNLRSVIVDDGTYNIGFKTPTTANGL